MVEYFYHNTFIWILGEKVTVISLSNAPQEFREKELLITKCLSVE